MGDMILSDPELMLTGSTLCTYPGSGQERRRCRDPAGAQTSSRDRLDRVEEGYIVIVSALSDLAEHTSR